MLQDGFLDLNKPLHVRKGCLPHWRQDGGLYFVTFRLADSLPQSRLLELRREWLLWQRNHRNPAQEVLETFTLMQRRRIEKWLDQGSGSCVLRFPAARAIVRAALEYFDGTRYELGPHTIAANHVHVLVRMAFGIDLSEALHSWKRYSSREISKLQDVSHVMNGRGHLSQVESFDHIVRDQRSLERYIQYIQSHR